MSKPIFNIKKGIFFLAMTFIIAIFSPSLQAQVETGHMMGFVYGEDAKTPIKDAQVIVTELEDTDKDNILKEFKSNITEDNGAYKIMNIPVGNYKVSIFLKDKPYKITRVDFLVHIKKDETTYVSFCLKKKRIPIAIIIGGTAAAAGAAILISVKKEKEQSPTRR